MEEEQDQRQFFKDLGATAEQTVQEARGVEEDYFVLLQRMLIAFPWVADITAKLQNYANQNFIIALDFSRELSQAKDIHDFARINVEFAQKALKMAGEQAEDFTEACAGWQSSLDFVPHNYWHESRAELRGFAGRISINCLNGSEPSDRARAISLT